MNIGDIGWHFGSGEGTIQGFNEAGIDTFRGDPIQSLVRETIQNSLDVREANDRPVDIRFTLTSLDEPESVAFDELARHFEAARAMEERNQGPGLAYWTTALERIAGGRIELLGVHDANTPGLTGPLTLDVNGAIGAWLALVHGQGVTSKSSTSALGSFGHGSRAPFAVSELRTVFYFSRLRSGADLTTRFQGRCVLQTVGVPDDDDGLRLTGPVGYFGIKEKVRPLEGDAIPSWAANMREAAGIGNHETGTSIFIPSPRNTGTPAQFWDQVRLGVIANFYFAIKQRNLIVHLPHGEVIDALALEAIFDSLDGKIQDGELQCTDVVRHRWQCATTLRFPDRCGTEDVEGFGRIDWAIRLQEDAEKAVAVARGNGMLIARNPERLERFRSVVPFDLFVCVSGESGSEMLRKLENPEHNKFSFDMVLDNDEKARVKLQYKTFAAWVRDLVGNLASVPPVDEEAIDDLDDFFQGDTGNATLDPDMGEKSSRITVVSRRTGAQLSHKPQIDAPGPEERPGRGVTGGDGPGGEPGGSVPGEGPGISKTSRRAGVAVKNLRVVAEDDRSGYAMVAFTPVGKERKRLVLLRSGESHLERIHFWTVASFERGQSPQDSLELDSVERGGRKHLRLVFTPDDLKLAIEGRLE